MKPQHDRPCPPGIQLVGFDVDGVFTDGRFYLSDDGVETKAFNTQDGFGIRQLLNAGVSVAVISGRQSAAVEKRMQELGVSFVFQGCKDKVAAFDSVVANLESNSTDAFLSVTTFRTCHCCDMQASRLQSQMLPRLSKNVCDHVTESSGGAGAVREVCEYVLSNANVDRG